MSAVKTTFLALALMMVAGSSPVLAQSNQDLVQLTLLAGDSLAVRFPEPFCASSLEPGQAVRAEVAEDKLISSIVVIEAGAPVKVTVEDVESSGRKGKPGRLKLTFQSVTAVDGAEIPLTGELELEGGGRNILLKVFTLFLIKGHDPCVGTLEHFNPKFKEQRLVFVPHP